MLFGAIVLITGPLWARKAWGVWWQWDARLTSSLLLWMMFVAYLLVRRYGGPGSDKLAAAVGALRDGQRAVRLRVGQRLAHAAPQDDGRAQSRPGDARAVLVLRPGVPALFLVLLALRVRLAEQQATLDARYLELDDRASA